MSFLTTLVSSKAAVAALAVGTLAVGGAAAAVATGSLPAPQTQNARAPFSVPASAETPSADASESASESASETESPTASDSASSADASSSATPVGPDATGPAAFGLCTAFGKGGLNSASVAYRNLAQAAGGASNIATYCATVKAPGQAASHMPASAMPTQAASGLAHAPSTPGGAATTPVMPTQASTGTTHKPTSVGRP